MSQPNLDVNPARIFDMINAYQSTAALKAGIELNIFTVIAEGKATAAEIAAHAQTSERGTRILCDYLTIIGFLTKEDGKYDLAPDAAAFLDRKSPMYLGSVVDFLLSPTLAEGFANLTEAVRKGTTMLPGQGTVDPDDPVWVQFAQGMGALMIMPSQLMADLVPVDDDREVKLLDVAAGHGLFGIAFAQRHPKLQVYALDWQAVLEVAKGNADASAVGDRYHLVPGSAFEVDFGTGYDLALLTNFLHHFDKPTIVEFLKKLHRSLADGGRVVTLEFVPNDDRVTPPGSGQFSLIMLASTPAGDAYTFTEFDEMFREAGFSRSEIHTPPQSMEQIVISYK
jgi:SAM-dependent methyltransferase